MNRPLIKIKKDGYVLEEVKINSDFIFYREDNEHINVEDLQCLFWQFEIEKLKYGDNLPLNDIRYTYLDNMIKVKTISFKSRKKIL